MRRGRHSAKQWDEVREAIKRIGGTLPENLPPAEHIKQVEKRIKHATPRLELDGPDAHGLIGQDVVQKRARMERNRTAATTRKTRLT